MAAKKVYDLAVKVSEYTDSEGKVKGRYQNIGCVLEKDDGGKFLMIEKWFNPAGVPDFDGKGQGRSSILVSMFEPKERDGNGGGAAPRQQRASSPGAKKAQEMLGKQQDYGDIPF